MSLIVTKLDKKTRVVYQYADSILSGGTNRAGNLKLSKLLEGNLLIAYTGTWGAGGREIKRDVDQFVTRVAAIDGVNQDILLSEFHECFAQKLQNRLHPLEVQKEKLEIMIVTKVGEEIISKVVKARVNDNNKVKTFCTSVDLDECEFHSIGHEQAKEYFSLQYSKRNGESIKDILELMANTLPFTNVMATPIFEQNSLSD